MTIDDQVTVINPAGMGCSGRGVLELELPERSGVIDFCYASGDAAVFANAVTEALDDVNNRCYRYSRKRNPDQPATDAADSYFCYNSTLVSNAEATTANTGPAGTVPTDVAITNTATPAVVTGCKSYRYVKDVTADSPSGYIFSHISQSNAHFRMNFPGYEK